MHICLLKIWKLNSRNYVLWKEIFLEGLSDIFRNLNLNSSCQSKIRQDSVAPPRRKKLGATGPNHIPARAGKQQVSRLLESSPCSSSLKAGGLKWSERWGIECKFCMQRGLINLGNSSKRCQSFQWGRGCFWFLKKQRQQNNNNKTGSLKEKLWAVTSRRGLRATCDRKTFSRKGLGQEWPEHPAGPSILF